MSLFSHLIIFREKTCVLGVAKHKIMCYHIFCLIEDINILYRYKAKREVKVMKAGLHPEYKKATIKCGCGNVIEVGSTKESMAVETCSKCHPFYTGSQKNTVVGGRSERFKKKFS